MEFVHANLHIKIPQRGYIQSLFLHHLEKICRKDSVQCPLRFRLPMFQYMLVRNIQRKHLPWHTCRMARALGSSPSNALRQMYFPSGRRQRNIDGESCIQGIRHNMAAFTGEPPDPALLLSYLLRFLSSSRLRLFLPIRASNRNESPIILPVSVFSCFIFWFFSYVRTHSFTMSDQVIFTLFFLSAIWAILLHLLILLL